MVKERDYGLDIVRIISMLGIVTLHINGAGGVLDACEKSRFQYWVFWFVEVIAYTSVDVFGLLSGYLGINKKKSSCYRTLELVCIVFFYCCLITAIFLLSAPDKIDGIKGLLSGFFPQIKGRYWYITCYIPIGIFQPYINKMILSLSEKAHLKLCLLITAVFGFIQSFVIVDLFKFDRGYSFVWLLCLYIIGAYLKRANIADKIKKLSVKCGLVFICGALVLTFGNLFIFKVINRQISYFTSYISPITMIMSISLVLMLSKVHIDKFGSLLAFFSSVAFDVYLIHCHIYIFDYLIKDNFVFIKEYTIITAPLIMVLWSVLIFLSAALMGGLRVFCFRVIRLNLIIGRISGKIDNAIYSAE